MTQQPLDELAETLAINAVTKYCQDLPETSQGRVILFSHRAEIARTAIRAYISNAWQPIKDMPYNEDMIVYGSYLYGGDTNITELIYMGSRCKGEFPDSKDYIDTGSEKMQIVNFSHFMPLPLPPTQSIEGRE